jgi:hypothetical protein
LKPETAQHQLGTFEEDPADVAALQASRVPEIALEGTIKVPAVHEGHVSTSTKTRRLKILVDSGASHSFFDDTLATEL